MDRLILPWRIEPAEDAVLVRMEVGKVCRELRIPEPEVYFFYPSDRDRERGLLGFHETGSRAIYLNCRLKRGDLLSVARHETRHFYQTLNKARFGAIGYESRERDALIYELANDERYAV